jgi:hypothetical protein
MMRTLSAGWATSRFVVIPAPDGGWSRGSVPCFGLLGPRLRGDERSIGTTPSPFSRRVLRPRLRLLPSLSPFIERRGWRALVRVPSGSPNKGARRAPAVAILGDRSAPDSWAGISLFGLSLLQLLPLPPPQRTCSEMGCSRVKPRRSLAHAPCFLPWGFRPPQGTGRSAGRRVSVPPDGMGATPRRQAPLSPLRLWPPPVGAPS